jgi:hypothetical protein
VFNVTPNGFPMMLQQGDEKMRVSSTLTRWRLLIALAALGTSATAAHADFATATGGGDVSVVVTETLGSFTQSKTYDLGSIGQNSPITDSSTFGGYTISGLSAYTTAPNNGLSVTDTSKQQVKLSATLTNTGAPTNASFAFTVITTNPSGGYFSSSYTGQAYLNSKLHVASLTGPGSPTISNNASYDTGTLASVVQDSGESLKTTGTISSPKVSIASLGSNFNLTVNTTEVQGLGMDGAVTFDSYGTICILPEPSGVIAALRACLAWPVCSGSPAA